MDGRFELVTVEIVEADGSDATYEIIKDRESLQTVEFNGDRFRVGAGYIRCHGRHFVGTFGRHQPVYGGRDDDVYYSRMTLFDGEWRHTGPDSNGNYSYVNGGELFDALERFAAEINLAASH